MKYEEQLIYFIMLFWVLYFGAEIRYDNMSNSYRAIVACIIFVSLVGSMKQSSPFSRLRYLWRFMLWFAVTYNAFLIFIFFQNEKEARNFMKLGDESLGVPVGEQMHTYDTNCEFELKNIYDNMDHYFLSHCVNWTMAALILRDAFILNLWQVWDEVIELSWEHILPHFRECWWDHLILDMLIGNTIFIIIGLYIIKIFKIDYYDWLGRYKKKSIKDWEIWTNYHHFGSSIAIMGTVTLNFLNGFFLMNQLWIPPKNWIVIYRLIVWFFMGNLGFREYWDHLLGKKASGQARFLVVWTNTIEALISIKFIKDAGNIQYVPTPLVIIIFWISIIVLPTLYYCYLRFFLSHKKPWTKIEEINNPVEVEKKTQ